MKDVPGDFVNRGIVVDSTNLTTKRGSVDWRFVNIDNELKLP